MFRPHHRDLNAKLPCAFSKDRPHKNTFKRINSYYYYLDGFDL